MAFNREQAQGLVLKIHFQFTGKEERLITVAIGDGRLEVQEGHVGDADLRVRADSQSWLKIAGKETSPFWPVLTGKLKISGSPMLLMKFQNCIDN